MSQTNQQPEKRMAKVLIRWAETGTSEYFVEDFQGLSQWFKEYAPENFILVAAKPDVRMERFRNIQTAKAIEVYSVSSPDERPKDCSGC